MASLLGFQKSLKSLDIFESFLVFLVITIVALAMLASIQAKIGYVVVASVAIYVMYGLVFGKWSSDMFCHNQSVFRYPRAILVLLAHGASKFFIGITQRVQGKSGVSTFCGISSPMSILLLEDFSGARLTKTRKASSPFSASDFAANTIGHNVSLEATKATSCRNKILLSRREIPVSLKRDLEIVLVYRTIKEKVEKAFVNWFEHGKLLFMNYGCGVITIIPYQGWL